VGDGWAWDRRGGGGGGGGGVGGEGHSEVVGRLAAVEVVLCLFCLYWLVLQVCVARVCERESGRETKRNNVHTCMHAHSGIVSVFLLARLVCV